MPFKELQENLKILSELMEQIISTKKDKTFDTLSHHHVAQNLKILNDMMSISIESMKNLKQANHTHQVISLQAKFANDLTQKLHFSTQYFLNASLNHISDYNEWLKMGDLATD